MDKNGVLLAKRSFVIDSKDDLADIAQRGGGLYIDVADSEAHHRAYVERLHTLVRTGKSLGEIADAKISGNLLANRKAEDDEGPDWLDLQVQTNALLRDTQPTTFMDRLQRLNGQLTRHTRNNPDGTLFALIQLSATEVRMYSATHAMLVGCVCMVVAREMLRWPDARVLQVGSAALTMNIAMTELQDQLAQQSQPLTSQQIVAVEDHASRSEQLLRRLGVADPVWLEAVLCHHHRSPGPLAKKSEAQQMARLVQRADIFGARLAPRVARSPMPVTAAMQASYYDEEHRVDEAGAALVKTLGVYPPGAFVRLATQEVAVVLRRGATATTPRVAVVMNRDGMPTGEMIPRDTSQAAWKITGVVAYRDIRVQLPLDRLLALV